MEVKAVIREAITVLGVQARPTDLGVGALEMWEERFVPYHDQLVALSSDKVYYGCAFSTDQPGKKDHLAGMGVLTSAVPPEGLTLREIRRGIYAMVECTIDTQDDAFDLIEATRIPNSEYDKDISRPTLDCCPPGSVEGSSPRFNGIPIAKKAQR